MSPPQALNENGASITSELAKLRNRAWTAFRKRDHKSSRELFEKLYDIEEEQDINSTKTLYGFANSLLNLGDSERDIFAHRIDIFDAIKYYID